MISFEAETGHTKRPLASVIPSFNVKKANWPEFTAYLQNQEQNLLRQVEAATILKNYDELGEVITAAVLKAAKASIPYLCITERSKP